MRHPRRFSRYLTMRDGTRIAVDVHLPVRARQGGRVPAVLKQTRYFRSVRLRPGLERAGLASLFDEDVALRGRFLAAGYAWVAVDVRGSGASGGHRPCPWGPEERRDGVEVVSWIVRQPWATGRVGALGTSYDGTAGEMLLAEGHPAVRALAARFSLFDVYADILRPGGVHLAWFSREWGRVNAAFDANDFQSVVARVLRVVVASEALAPRGRPLGALARVLDGDPSERLVAAALSRVFAGVRPVDGDTRGRLLAAAVAEHAANWDVERSAGVVDFRDDVPPGSDFSCDDFSPHRVADAVASSGAAVMCYSGWFDAAYHAAAIARFSALPNAELLLIGPWEHGGRLDVSPAGDAVPTAYDHPAELVAFFDRHLKAGEETEAPAPVRYYTYGAERWRYEATWPPRAERLAFHLDAGGRLSRSAPAAGEASADVYVADPGTGTGPASRWRSLIGPHRYIGYPDRARRDRRLLVYDSEALPRDLEITGHPVLRLFVTSSEPDLDVFAYLEEVRPNGEVVYITEGMLKASHRRPAARGAPYPTPGPYRSHLAADAAPLEVGEAVELVFDLFPCSFLLRAGHALRLAVAGADRDAFAVFRGRAPVMRVHRSRRYPSQIEVPAAIRGGF